MKGTVQKLTIGKYECLLYLPQEYEVRSWHYPAVYLNGGDNISGIMEGVEPHFDVTCKPFILLSVQTENWNRDFSPWPAPPLMRTEAFDGGAPGYLSFLADTAKPYLDHHYRTLQGPDDTALAGYSLGGLAALYALYTCGSFGKIGSLSGSLWFDGWVDYMESHMPANTRAKVYLSLGQSEERSRNPRMARVGDCTRRAAEILAGQLDRTENLVLEWNDGGHFTEIPQRIQKGLLWLMQS